MRLDVLICHADGTQTLEHREVPDDWFSPEEDGDAPAGPEPV